MRTTRLSAFLALTLLASVSVVGLAPTAAAHTCYGYNCGPCVEGEDHEHHYPTYPDGPAYCASSKCDLRVYPVCVIIERLASGSTSVALLP